MSYVIGFDSTNNCVKIESLADNSSINLKPDGSGQVKVNGSNFVDLSRNISCANITATGYVDSESYVDAATGFKVNGTTVINSSRQLTNIDSVVCDAMSTGTITSSGSVSSTSFMNAGGGLRVNGTEIITSARVLQNVTASASIITSGTFGASQIPNLDASKITSGTFSASRIPSLDASKITSGTFSADRIPTLSISKISGLQSNSFTTAG